MVDNESFTINPQDMATYSKGNAILEILKGELGKMNFSRLSIMALMIESIIKTQSICLWKLCEVIPLKAKPESINRRMQRFISQVALDASWLAKFIFRICGCKDEVYLIMDRTNWKLGRTNINILMLAISYEGKGVPILWKFLNKRGNSNEEERIALIDQFRIIFPLVRIAGFLADREFVGEDWFRKLKELNIPFLIRVRSNFKIRKNYKFQKIQNLFRRSPLNSHKIYRCKKLVLGVPLYVSGIKLRNKQNKIEYCIIVSNENQANPIETYQRRWQIENMFKNLKTSGFNFEATHVTKHERLSNLLSLLSIGYIWITKVANKVLKENPIQQILSHGRNNMSHFRVGLRSIRNAISNSFSKLYISYVELLSYT